MMVLHSSHSFNFSLVMVGFFFFTFFGDTRFSTDRLSGVLGLRMNPVRFTGTKSRLQVVERPYGLRRCCRLLGGFSWRLRPW